MGDGGWLGGADGDEGVGGVVGVAETVDFDLGTNARLGADEDMKEAGFGGLSRGRISTQRPFPNLWGYQY